MLSCNFYYSLTSYFPFVTCVTCSSQDRILQFRQCFLGFLVHYYITISFHIGEGALECHLPIKFSETKRFRKIRNTSTAVQVYTFKRKRRKTIDSKMREKNQIVVNVIVRYPLDRDMPTWFSLGLVWHPLIRQACLSLQIKWKIETNIGNIVSS